jgi:hypothetical protein
MPAPVKSKRAARSRQSTSSATVTCDGKERDQMPHRSSGLGIGKFTEAWKRRRNASSTFPRWLVARITSPA